MIEKVNPKHPDKVADRIAGAIVDLAYKLQENPKIAVEVLIGHNECNIIIETSVEFSTTSIDEIVRRIAGDSVITRLHIVPQDVELAKNQSEGFRCGDNGIFKGMPISDEQIEIGQIAKKLYEKYNSDGKYILDKAGSKLIVCQSNADNTELKALAINELNYDNIIINPLGEWIGGINVDTGATNRKLGSDMGEAVTGGGLHGKDLSKADVSVNIYAFLKAQEIGKPVELYCAIGDTEIDGIPYEEIVDLARKFIDNIGGFEKFAEWGLF